jgi:uncharacterized membrane protein YvlD (DUF360 family)
MVEMLIRIAIKALAFYYLLPMIHGISFHGNFLHALGLAIFFSIMLRLVELVTVALAAYLTITTLGLALLVLIPLWVFGFWVLPVIALKFVADLMPHYLTVSGWIPAIWGGLILLVISLLTGGFTHIRRSLPNRR